MMAALVILLALFVVGFPLYIHHRLTAGRAGSGEPDAPDGGNAGATESQAPEAAGEGEECCGQHAVCERDSLLAAVSRDIVYYDDEELDAFRGRLPADYTPAETEMFRDVLLTLLPDDIAGWGRSLQLRGIELPEGVRDEFLLMVSEVRSSHLSQPKTS